uniref:Uncharacterized protein n=1 Tax=Anguilla anguilla TaxID=7936 RepID=A0A0E9WEW6_ANGAN
MDVPHTFCNPMSHGTVRVTTSDCASVTQLSQYTVYGSVFPSCSCCFSPIASGSGGWQTFWEHFVSE